MLTLDLQHLFAFVAVAECGSVNKAAARCFTTPSAVSAQIKQLEETLNTTLFHRSPRGVTLTDAGMAMLAKARHVLDAAQQLQEGATSPHTDQPPIRLGLNASVRFLRIPQLMASLAVSPIPIHLDHLSTGKILMSLVASHENVPHEKMLDLGFAFGEVHDVTLIVHPLTVAKLAIIAPIAWQEQLKGASWATLATLPWICSDYYCPFQTIVDQWFSERSLRYHQIMQSDHEGSKLELVADGVGVTLVEYHEALSAAEQGRVALWTDTFAYATLSLVHRRQPSVTVRTVRDAILRVWRD